MPVKVAHIFAFMVILTSGASGATTAPRKPDKPVELANCVTAECHANIKASTIIHGPIAANACDACHEVLDASKHTFTTTRQKAELCTYCHEFNVEGMPVVHKPVARGECLGCHDPHGGANHNLTRENSTRELCGRCHDSIARGKRFLHGPVEKGACDSCHAPHASRFPKLVDVVGADLCLTCHTEFEAKMTQVRFTHEALQDGCEKCHDVHGSSSPNATTQPVAEQCTGCHEPVRRRATAAKVKHSIIMSDRACMNCHTPHGGNSPKLMADVPAKLCLTCHDKPIKAQRGVTLAATNDVTDPKLFKHGAIKDGQCSGCHDAHGGDRAMLLAKPNSTAFYQKFSADQYALCFSCHDARLALQERISTVTNFRDGDRNLHYVHVTVGARSHSCGVCHDAHTGDNHFILRDRIPYGIWLLPMNFRKTETGGTCASGCHVPFGYDREHAIGPTTFPAAQQPPIVARGETDKPPKRVSFTARDTRGNDVTVPPTDRERPSVLIFLGADQERNRALLVELESIGSELRRANVLIITSSATFSARWPVILDADDELAEHVGVHGWPSVAVADGTGAVLARVSGPPAIVAIKLSGYVRGSEREPVPEEVVSDGHRTRASHDAQVAEQLLADGKLDRALKLLNAALKDAPDSVPLRLAMVKALCAAGRWDEAEKQVHAVLAVDPSLAEAHYQLGRIYDHKGDLKRAAAAYRASHDKAGH
jgi:predicted CXXCH cytochrome family protein